MRQRQLRLFELLSVVNDLQLISSMCSACGNASHVATAGKTGLDGGLVVGLAGGGGFFFVFDPNGEESAAPVPLQEGSLSVVL